MNNKYYHAELMRYYEEVLAQSARNYAFTLDKKWEERYIEVEKMSDKLLKTAIKKANSTDKDFFSKMDVSNQKLVRMEHLAIEFVNNSKAKHAMDLLESKKYLDERKILAEGLEVFVEEHYEQESSPSIISKSVKEIVSLERRLVILEKQLEEEKFTIVGRFASKMAHDLRNPLSIIQVSLENMKMLYGGDEIQIKQFKKIECAIDRMAHQVEGVLDFVREQPRKMSRVKMSEVISESVDSLNIPDNIKVILPKNDVRLLCDKRQFVVILNNLILNSIQAIKDKGIVELDIIEKNNSIIIKIEDSGQGISKDTINDVFEPLFTTKQQGTGLGLVSVKSIINAHGGKISVTSPPTIFTITLPKSGF